MHMIVVNMMLCELGQKVAHTQQSECVIMNSFVLYKIRQSRSLRCLLCLSIPDWESQSQFVPLHKVLLRFHLFHNYHTHSRIFLMKRRGRLLSTIFSAKYGSECTSTRRPYILANPAWSQILFNSSSSATSPAWRTHCTASCTSVTHRNLCIIVVLETSWTHILRHIFLSEHTGDVWHLLLKIFIMILSCNVPPHHRTIAKTNDLYSDAELWKELHFDLMSTIKYWRTRHILQFIKDSGGDLIRNTFAMRSKHVHGRDAATHAGDVDSLVLFCCLDTFQRVYRQIQRVGDGPTHTISRLMMLFY